MKNKNCIYLIGFIQEHGTLVYLKAGVDDIMHRIGEGSARPVFKRLDKGKGGVEILFKERERYYNQVDLIVEHP